MAAGTILVSTGCRQDMHDQPKFIPLRANDFYPDQRSARDPIPGTVAYNGYTEDMYFLTGKHGRELGNDLPFKLDAKVLARGQDRYNIYCAPCHSRVGDGLGMIVQRGYKRPPTFHQDRLRNAPVGHFFDVMSNGFGAMPDYSSQVKPADRWAIAAYIRALQLSQKASEADVTAQDRNKLTAPQTQNEIRLSDTSIKNPQSMPGQPQGGKQ